MTNQPARAIAAIAAVGALVTADGVPMVVAALDTSHVGGTERVSAVCIPAGTTPFDLQDAHIQRKVAADDYGSKPDWWGSPCPNGPTLAEGSDR